MNQDNFESELSQPEASFQGSIRTVEDDGRECYLADSGLGILVNIMRVSQHWGRPAVYSELDDEMQREIRLWSRALLTEDHDAIFHRIRDCCRVMLERDDPEDP